MSEIVAEADHRNRATTFTPTQAQRLIRLARREVALTPRETEQLVIDLSWASSHLEGNTYSQIVSVR